MCSGFLVTAKGFLDPPEKSGTVQGRYGEQLRLARRHPRGAFSFARVHFAFHFRRTTTPCRFAGTGRSGDQPQTTDNKERRSGGPLLELRRYGDAALW